MTSFGAADCMIFEFCIVYTILIHKNDPSQTLLSSVYVVTFNISSCRSTWRVLWMQMTCLISLERHDKTTDKWNSFNLDQH